MDPKELIRYRGQIVELMFDDGARVRAHLLSVDPEVAENHVFYEALRIIAAGTGHDWVDAGKSGFAASAEEITALVPTDGQ